MNRSINRWGDYSINYSGSDRQPGHGETHRHGLSEGKLIKNKGKSCRHSRVRILDGKEPQSHQCHLQWCPNLFVPPPSATSSSAQIHQRHLQEQPQPGEVPLCSPLSRNLIPPHPTRHLHGGRAQTKGLLQIPGKLALGQAMPAPVSLSPLESAGASSVHLCLAINGWWGPYGAQ